MDLTSIRSRGRMGEADWVSILRGPSRTLVFKHGCRMQERMPSPCDGDAWWTWTSSWTPQSAPKTEPIQVLVGGTNVPTRLQSDCPKKLQDTKQRWLPVPASPVGYAETDGIIVFGSKTRKGLMSA